MSFRKAHVLTANYTDYWIEKLAEAIYAGVGIARTEAFDLTKFYPLYPPTRMHFDYHQMVYNERFDDTVDDLAHQKAISLAVRLVSEEIVEQLSKADGANYADAAITMNDFLGKMFLDSGKGEFDTDRMAVQILDDFVNTVTESTVAVSAAKVDKSFRFAEIQSTLI